MPDSKTPQEQTFPVTVAADGSKTAVIEIDGKTLNFSFKSNVLSDQLKGVNNGLNVHVQDVVETASFDLSDRATAYKNVTVADNYRKVREDGQVLSHSKEDVEFLPRVTSMNMPLMDAFRNASDDNIISTAEAKKLVELVGRYYDAAENGNVSLDELSGVQAVSRTVKPGGKTR